MCTGDTCTTAVLANRAHILWEGKDIPNNNNVCDRHNTNIAINCASYFVPTINSYKQISEDLASRTMKYLRRSRSPGIVTAALKTLYPQLFIL